MSKLNVAVIFGGASSEYEISLMSANLIINSICKQKYNVHLIGITKQGKWLNYIGNAQNIKDDYWINDKQNCIPAIISPDAGHKGFIRFIDDKFEKVGIDCFFPVLHGKNGEDGTIQGLFELSKVAYVGCDVLSSAICMDKDIAHQVLESNRIKTAKWVTILKPEWELNKDISKIKQTLTYPVFVKPANAGSSVGVSKAENEAELIIGVDLAFMEDDKVIVETGIVGKEIECAVMGNYPTKASIVGEISPSSDFYDFEDKYIKGTSTVRIPAPIKDETAEKIREIAKKAYEKIGCKGLARVDFFVTENDEIYLNEINTLPGFTPISMYPMLWDKTGISNEKLVDDLIELALNRKN